MPKHGKNYKAAAAKVESTKLYSPKEAMELAKELAPAKFDETVEVAVRLGVDTRKADQNVRGSISLPHGTGKTVRVAVFAEGEKAREAEAAGADVIGSDDLVAQIQAGELNFDAAIATPNMMGKVGRLGKILGPRGLMPNPKLGTVTMDVAKMVGELKAGRVEYRADRSAPYLPSAWDNRFVVNVSGTWDLPRSWSVGMRLSAVGGSPYTPYDEEKSSLVEAWDVQGRPYYDYTQYNARRLDAFAQLDVRVDKTFYFRRCMLGFYIDLQNVTVSKLRQPDVLMSTGVVENPEAPLAEQRYRMKRIAQVSGTLLPTLGITVEF